MKQGTVASAWTVSEQRDCRYENPPPVAPTAPVDHRGNHLQTHPRLALGVTLSAMSLARMTAVAYAKGGSAVAHDGRRPSTEGQVGEFCATTGRIAAGRRGSHFCEATPLSQVKQL